jgi:MFS superfamily sulfate permease-like transporter
MELAIKFKNDKLVGDFWGGLAAMLVALPSAIAFGVTIYAAIGPSYAGLGALAGILGATALGLVAPGAGRYQPSDYRSLRAGRGGSLGLCH